MTNTLFLLVARYLEGVDRANPVDIKSFCFSLYKEKILNEKAYLVDESISVILVIVVLTGALSLVLPKYIEKTKKWHCKILQRLFLIPYFLPFSVHFRPFKYFFQEIWVYELVLYLIRMYLLSK